MKVPVFVEQSIISGLYLPQIRDMNLTARHFLFQGRTDRHREISVNQAMILIFQSQIFGLTQRKNVFSQLIFTDEIY